MDWPTIVLGVLNAVIINFSERPLVWAPDLRQRPQTFTIPEPSKASPFEAYTITAAAPAPSLTAEPVFNAPLSFDFFSGFFSWDTLLWILLFAVMAGWAVLAAVERAIEVYRAQPIVYATAESQTDAMPRAVPPTCSDCEKRAQLGDRAGRPATANAESQTDDPSPATPPVCSECEMRAQLGDHDERPPPTDAGSQTEGLSPEAPPVCTECEKRAQLGDHAEAPSYTSTSTQTELEKSGGTNAASQTEDLPRAAPPTCNECESRAQLGDHAEAPSYTSTTTQTELEKSIPTATLESIAFLLFDAQNTIKAKGTSVMVNGRIKDARWRDFTCPLLETQILHDLDIYLRGLPATLQQFFKLVVSEFVERECNKRLLQNKTRAKMEKHEGMAPRVHWLDQWVDSEERK